MRFKFKFPHHQTLRAALIWGLLTFLALGSGYALYSRRNAQSQDFLSQGTLKKTEWVIDPSEPGPDLPPVGRSLFDSIVKSEPIPFPFQKLLKRLQELTQTEDNYNIDSTGLIRLLFPQGRSLQRLAASPEFYRFPRIVVNVTGDPLQNELSESGLNLRDRLFLGYQPKASAIEVVSYNEQAGRFEFQQILDYRSGAVPRLVYSHRGECLVCHQNQAPIFSEQPWSESNGHREISERILQAQDTQTPGRYFGVPIDLKNQTDLPEAFDKSVRRANLLSLYQKLWKDSCQHPDLEKSIACFQNLMFNVLQYGLSHDNGSEMSSIGYRLVQESWRRRGAVLDVPDSKIRDRNPLLHSQEKKNDAAQIGVAVSPSLLASITNSNIPVRFEPAIARGPLREPYPPFNQALDPARDPVVIQQLIPGLASFFSDRDFYFLDQELYARREFLEAAEETVTSHCHLTSKLTQTAPVAGPMTFECDLQDQDAQSNSFVAEGEFSVDGQGSIQNGGFRRFRTLFHDAICVNCQAMADAIFTGQFTDLGHGEWQASGEIRNASSAIMENTAQLHSRMDNGDLIDSVSLKYMNQALLVTVKIVHDFQALKSELQKNMALADFYATGVFQREPVLAALRSALSFPQKPACCEASAPQPRLAEPANLSNQKNLNRAQIAFLENCSPCHAQGQGGYPARFLVGDLTQNLNSCKERIYYRLLMWQYDQADRAKNKMRTPMPPLLKAASQKEWIQSDDYQVMLSYMAELNQKSATELVQHDFNLLKACHVKP